jgi:hypothetical protein
MLIQILMHTPRWVFVLFFALLAFGVQQLFARTATLRRISVLPVALLALSLAGVASTFAAQPLSLAVWALCAGAGTALTMTRPLPAGTRFDAATRRFSLPGSAAPLALMMGVFFTKYLAGVALSISPQLASQAGFAFAFSALYGLFSGLFAGRAARLWRLAIAATQSPHALTA